MPRRNCERDRGAASMAEAFERLIYFNGELIAAGDAKIHVLSPAVRYGAMVFEGLRAYWNPGNQELYVFRLLEHSVRLHQSMKMMRMEPLPDPVEIMNQVETALRSLEVRQDVHIRQMVLVDGQGEIWARGPLTTAVTVHAKGRPDGFHKGIRCCVSSWVRISDQSLPPRIKCAANYQNGRLAALQAREDGYDAPILLTNSGKVAEAWGACVMLIREGTLVTPSRTSGILESVTRDTLLKLAGEVGLEAEEREVDRTELYVASEVFLCGSSFEITPVVSVDGLPVGDGIPGRYTKQLQELFLRVARGEHNRYKNWLHPVYKRDH